MATNKATPSRCRLIGQQPGRAVAGGVCFSQPCTCRAAHSHLACCLPKDLHSRRKGRGEGSTPRWWPAASRLPAPLHKWRAALPVSATPRGPQRRPSSARPRPRRTCDSAVPGLACLACQGGSEPSARSKRVTRALVSGASPGPWGKGQRPWDFRAARGRGAHGQSQERPSQAHPSLSFLDLSVALTLPPSEESLPAFPFTPFQVAQPQESDKFSGP